MNFIFQYIVANPGRVVINCESNARCLATPVGDINVSQHVFSTSESNGNASDCKCQSPKKKVDDNKSEGTSCKRTNPDECDSEPLRKKTNLADSVGETTNTLDCAVCLQPCVLPVQLSCRHIFCYLCVKGMSLQNDRRCALCRQEIPQNFLDKPLLLQSPVVDENNNRWFYEGRNGWWQYDDRTSAEIEEAYEKGEPRCEVSIAGYQYIIDLQENRQFRKDELGRRRRIKRDLVSVSNKGVAGIGMNSSNKHVQLC